MLQRSYGRATKGLLTSKREVIDAQEETQESAALSACKIRLEQDESDIKQSKAELQGAQTEARNVPRQAKGQKTAILSAALKKLRASMESYSNTQTTAYKQSQRCAGLDARFCVQLLEADKTRIIERKKKLDIEQSSGKKSSKRLKTLMSRYEEAQQVEQDRQPICAAAPEGISITTFQKLENVTRHYGNKKLEVENIEHVIRTTRREETAGKGYLVLWDKMRQSCASAQQAKEEAMDGNCEVQGHDHVVQLYQNKSTSCVNMQVITSELIASSRWAKQAAVRIKRWTSKSCDECLFSWKDIVRNQQSEIKEVLAEAESRLQDAQNQLSTHGKNAHTQSALLFATAYWQKVKNTTISPFVLDKVKTATEECALSQDVEVKAQSKGNKLILAEKAWKKRLAALRLAARFGVTKGKEGQTKFEEQKLSAQQHARRAEERYKKASSKFGNNGQIATEAAYKAWQKALKAEQSAISNLKQGTSQLDHNQGEIKCVEKGMDKGNTTCPLFEVRAANKTAVTAQNSERTAQDRMELAQEAAHADPTRQHVGRYKAASRLFRISEHVRIEAQKHALDEQTKESTCKSNHAEIQLEQVHKQERQVKEGAHKALIKMLTAERQVKSSERRYKCNKENPQIQERALKSLEGTQEEDKVMQSEHKLHEVKLQGANRKEGLAQQQVATTGQQLFSAVQSEIESAQRLVSESEQEVVRLEKRLSAAHVAANIEATPRNLVKIQETKVALDSESRHLSARTLTLDKHKRQGMRVKISKKMRDKIMFQCHKSEVARGTYQSAEAKVLSQAKIYNSTKNLLDEGRCLIENQRGASKAAMEKVSYSTSACMKVKPWAHSAHNCIKASKKMKNYFNNVLSKINIKDCKEEASVMQTKVKEAGQHAKDAKAVVSQLTGKSPESAETRDAIRDMESKAKIHKEEQIKLSKIESKCAVILKSKVPSQVVKAAELHEQRYKEASAATGGQHCPGETKEFQEEERKWKAHLQKDEVAEKEKVAKLQERTSKADEVKLKYERKVKAAEKAFKAKPDERRYAKPNSRCYSTICARYLVACLESENLICKCKSN